MRKEKSWADEKKPNTTFTISNKEGGNLSFDNASTESITRGPRQSQLEELWARGRDTHQDIRGRPRVHSKVLLEEEARADQDFVDLNAVFLGGRLGK